jgi:hypothetical protein
MLRLPDFTGVAEIGYRCVEVVAVIRLGRARFDVELSKGLAHSIPIASCLEQIRQVKMWGIMLGPPRVIKSTAGD